MNQIYTAEQKKQLEKTVQALNALPYNDQAMQAYYIGIIAGLQIGKRKLYRQDAKTGLYIQTAEQLTPEQAKFAEAFPNKKIDCDIPARVDMDKLISALRRSSWLCSRDTISLKSCIKLYDDILAGRHDDKHTARDQRTEFTRRSSAAGIWDNQPEYEV